MARSAGQEAKLEPQDTLEALLTRANAGDGAAFTRFLRAVTPALRSVIRRKGWDLGIEAQEDILQEVLLAIHLKRQTWDPSAPVRPWLYAVARHKVVDAFRRRGSALHLPVEDFADVLEDDRVPELLSTRDADVMLGMIDARSAHLVRAMTLEGQSAEEAGARLGLTSGATRIALHRALRKLASLGQRMMK